MNIIRSLQMSALLFSLAFANSCASNNNGAALADRTDGCKRTDALSQEARDLMVAEHIASGEIAADAPEDLEFRWALTKAAVHKDVCVLSMHLCSVINGRVDRKQCSTTSTEVLALKNGHPALFETVVHIPDRVRFATFSTGGYYAEVTGTSARDAIKLIYAGENEGTGEMDYFRGTVVAGGKPSFDPTPNRNWHVVDASVSVRSTIWPEAFNIAAGFFDNDFIGTFENSCFHETSSTGVVGCAVGFGRVHHIVE